MCRMQCEEMLRNPELQDVNRTLKVASQWPKQSRLDRNVNTLPGSIQRFDVLAGVGIEALEVSHCDGAHPPSLTIVL
jgi:hypothetical protein